LKFFLIGFSNAIQHRSSLSAAADRIALIFIATIWLWCSNSNLFNQSTAKHFNSLHFNSSKMHSAFELLLLILISV
jgi:hypothetical protein